MKLNILPIGQKDARWASKKLGNGTGTIGNYGCLLICHSMMLTYYGHELLPDALNEVYKTQGVFDGNLINFYAAGKVFGDIVADEYYDCQDVPADLTKIDKYLEAKKPVIALVDFDLDPSNKVQSHFVLIIGKDENGSYFINDPWEGETYYFHAKYGDPARFIYGLRLYSGPPKESVNYQDQINDLTDKLKTCNEAVAAKSLEVNSLRDALNEQENDNRDLANQLLEARTQRDKATWDAERLELQNKSLGEEIESLKKKIESLEADKVSLNVKIMALEKDKVENWGFWRFIKAKLRR